MSASTCSIESCKEPVVARNWCSAHYARWYRHGDPLTDHRRRAIKASGCHPERPHYSKGLCQPCYLAQWHFRHLTVEEYEQALANQGGGCAVCHRPPDGRWKRLLVNRDLSGGLLCRRCSQVVSLLGDDPAITAAALVTYFEKYVAADKRRKAAS